ncbi:hypothetical protein SCATT_56630 [Streptantibioticus cattleyicolor NRRL 8057 = DSM 46488]|uniref:Uncharacterized protein n=1 Tax=Streptantibioticus cattleyicolor (strain ATCC 35852 / DSM 46488 / JCM 4925 / NBRC 14057 / NRRL 8057) TaxID=1003195 RepID=G8X439_STREN|nr:hypothetical protein SCATT_56630 [Streptantibioticus cattleyicolor NRRL 8057 = DSM 46488]
MPQVVTMAEGPPPRPGTPWANRPDTHPRSWCPDGPAP